MTQLIIANEKYDDRIFAAETTEDISRVALKILRERYDSGEYSDRKTIERDIERKKKRKREKLDQQLLNITDDELESSPDAVKKLVLDERAKLENAEKISHEDAMDLEFITKVEKLLALDMEEAAKLTKTYRTGREVSYAWDLLEYRNDYQYENVRFEHTEDY